MGAADNLTRRIERLEAELKQLRSEPQCLRAPFQIADHRGRVLFELDTAEGGARLRLFGKKGVGALSLSVGDDGGQVTVANVRGEPVAVIHADDTGGGMVSVSAPNGATRLFLNGNAEGGGLLVVIGPNGNIAAQVHGTAEGVALALFDGNGRQLTEVNADGI